MSEMPRTAIRCLCGAVRYRTALTYWHAGWVRVLHERHAFGYANHHGRGDLGCPCWVQIIKGNPDESQTGNGQREDTSECANDCRLPIHVPPVQANNLKIENDSTDRRPAQLPHDGAVDGEHQQLQLEHVMQRAHHKTDQQYVEKQSGHAYPEARA